MEDGRAAWEAAEQFRRTTQQAVPVAMRGAAEAKLDSEESGDIEVYHHEQINATTGLVAPVPRDKLAGVVERVVLAANPTAILTM